MVAVFLSGGICNKCPHSFCADAQTCIPVKRHRTLNHNFWVASMFAAINEGKAEASAFAPSGETVEAAEARIAASYEAALRLLQERHNDAAQVRALAIQTTSVTGTLLITIKQLMRRRFVKTFWRWHGTGALWQ